MAYLYVVLSAGCSVLIAHFLKWGESEKLRTLNILTVNYLIAAAVALAIDVPRPEALSVMFSPLPLLFCLGTGAFFIGNFLLYSKSVHVNGVGISIAAMRISLLVPVLVSAGIYQEELTLLKVGGILVTIAALLLLLPGSGGKKYAGYRSGWLLLAIFMLSGFADAALKTYQEEFAGRFSEMEFMSMVFGTAFLIGLATVVLRKGPLCTPREFWAGILVGLPNLGSAVFLIYALPEMDGAVAFPLVNTLIVLGGTLLGIAVWKDRLGARQGTGIVFAVMAILMLL